MAVVSVRLLAATLLSLLFITHPANADHDDRTAGVCARTTQVHDAIVATTGGITDCADITATHLARIPILSLDSQSITSLKVGDFAGLSALTGLVLSDNQFTTLPVGIFSELSALRTLTINNNRLVTLPASIFSGLSALTILRLHNNQLTRLPVGIFADQLLGIILRLDPGVIVQPPASAFVTTWETTHANETITIPTTGSGYNYNVDCDSNGINEFTGQTGNTTCSYLTPGVHTIVITGDFPSIYINNSGDKGKIRSVAQWGTGVWTSMFRAFYGANNFDVTAADTPVLTRVIQMTDMFRGTSRFTGTKTDMSKWNVSIVKSLGNMFRGASLFNGKIGGWNMREVRSLFHTFEGASIFNQDETFA